MSLRTFIVTISLASVLSTASSCSDDGPSSADGSDVSGSQSTTSDASTASIDTGSTSTDDASSGISTACATFGGNVAFGVSSYGGVRDWALDAHADPGIPWPFLYVYILNGGMEDPDNFRDWYVAPFVDATQSIGATPILTFYQLLDIGRDERGFTGSEADVVKQCIEDVGCMRTYFDNLVWLLQVIAERAPNAILHSEPDSWGFMMWAMGVEGNADSESVLVQVAASGHPDVAGFADSASGFGQALLALRDQYAPNVLMGWHASDFRVGSRPEVVTGFYAGLGSWDLLLTDGMHNEQDESTWWTDWDEPMLTQNLAWLRTVTTATGLPMLMWQLPIGNYDWHLIGDAGDRSMIGRFADAGVAGFLFEHVNHNQADDADDYRASGQFGTLPPPGSGAGGTAGDMKRRVAEYTQTPYPFACP